MVNTPELKIIVNEKFTQIKSCYEDMRQNGYRAMTWGWEKNSILMKMIVQRLRKDKQGMTIKMHNYGKYHWLEIYW